MHWMILPLKRYADFSGRSQRMEYWMYTLGWSIVMALLVAFMIIGAAVQGAENEYRSSESSAVFTIGFGLLMIFVLGTFLPSIAVTVRRLHDQDKSGWLYLLSFIPYAGGIILIILMCIDGTHGPNRFGDDPKDPGAAKVFE